MSIGAGAVTLGVGMGFTIGYTLNSVVESMRKKQQTLEKKELNGDIVEMIKQRMNKGRKEYGHGLLKGDRDWTKEALEEALDMSIYLSAKLVEISKH